MIAIVGKMNSTSDKLINSEIKVREVTYYLTTESDLQNVKSNSLLGDIFTLIASLTVGGMITVLLSKVTGINLSQTVIKLLDILLYVFIFFTLVFGGFAYYFFYKSFKIIQEIKGSGAVKSFKSEAKKDVEREKGQEENKQTKSNKRLEILEATYGTPKATLDVTKELIEMISGNTLAIVASNDIKGDPDVGTRKKLRIVYKIDGVILTKEFNERDMVVIS